MGKRVWPALVVVLLLAPGMVWSECRCSQPTAPELPPNRPSAAEMKQTNAEMTAYADAMKKYRECLVICLRSAESDLNHVVTEWNEVVEKFNRVKEE